MNMSLIVDNLAASKILIDAMEFDLLAVRSALYEMKLQEEAERLHVTIQLLSLCRNRLTTHMNSLKNLENEG
jgi:hypothetical protein